MTVPSVYEDSRHQWRLQVFLIGGDTMKSRKGWQGEKVISSVLFWPANNEIQAVIDLFEKDWQAEKAHQLCFQHKDSGSDSINPENAADKPKKARWGAASAVIPNVEPLLALPTSLSLSVFAFPVLEARANMLACLFYSFKQENQKSFPRLRQSATFREISGMFKDESEFLGILNQKTD